MEPIFQEMANRWPSQIVARTEVKQFTGGLITERYLSNLDCIGKGPTGRIKIGRKVCYPVNDFLNWLESRLEPVKTKSSEV